MTRTSVRSFASAIALPPLLALLAAACGHTDAFTTPESHSSGPFANGAPVRLTFAATADLEPAWLPGGAAIAYSYQRADRREGDRCIGLMPASGGAIARQVCGGSAFESDSITTFSMPTVSALGEIAYLRSSRPAATGQSGETSLVVAMVESPSPATVVRSVPFQGSEQFYAAIGRPAWIAAGELAFPGIVESVVLPCPGNPQCAPVLIAYSRHLLRLSTSAPGAVSVIPGTDFATSVTGGEAGGVIHYTVANDTRIFRQDLATGAVRPVHDFGPAGIPRELSFANGRIAAIVGGSVTVLLDSIGPLQTSGPGHLIVVDLATGAEEVPDASAMVQYQQPALSPTGEGLAAVRFDVTVSGGDVVALTTGDIVRFGAD